MGIKRMVVMTPTYDGYWEGTRDSCSQMVQELTDVEFTFLHVNEVYIHAGRRKLLQRAMELHRENRFNYFFWLDSDVEFTPKDMTAMIKAVDGGLPVVTGVYFSRHGNNNPMLCYGNPHDGYNFMIKKDWDALKKSERNKYFLIDGCGFGFYIISAQAMVDYTSKIEATKWFDSSGWFPTRDHPNDQQYVIGEDIYFCRMMKLIGYPTLVNSHVLLKHKGVGVEDWYENMDKDTTHCPVMEEFF